MDGTGSVREGGVPPEVFAEGDLVVYPNHGAGYVAGVEEKTVLGESRRYYVVYIADGELTLNIPADGDTDLRSCADEVVRDLSAYGGEHGLSTGERNLLAKARRILISEVAMCKNLTAEGAEALVDDALGGDGEGPK